MARLKGLDRIIDASKGLDDFAYGSVDGLPLAEIILSGQNVAEDHIFVKYFSGVSSLKRGWTFCGEVVPKHEDERSSLISVLVPSCRRVIQRAHRELHGRYVCEQCAYFGYVKATHQINYIVAQENATLLGALEMEGCIIPDHVKERALAPFSVDENGQLEWVMHIDGAEVHAKFS